jgi:lipoprotein signal peptidase
MAQRSFRNWLLFLALLGAGLDQISKYAVFYWLQQPAHFDPLKSSGTLDIWDGKFKLYTQYSPDGIPGGRQPQVNQGALFGLGNKGEGTANKAFALVSVLAGVAIVVWSFRRNAAGDRLLCSALGLILAGTMGNLYDRLVFHGVRDFLYWYGYIDWPVFNVADCCLVCGALLLLAQAFLARPVVELQPTAVASHPVPLPLPAPEVVRAN